jgi:two-component system phosphate regulon sensor histidine kinase PhoR
MGNDDQLHPNYMGEIVHELKSPLAAVKQFMDMITQSGSLNDVQAAFVQRTYRKLDYMFDLVDEVLDAAWLEAGTGLTLEPVDLNDLAKRCTEQLSNYAQRQDVQLVLDLPPDMCTIKVDGQRIESAVSNLINNAIKYSPNGGTVHIAVEMEDEMAVVSVEDEGLGISPEHLPFIFDHFYRARTPDTRRIDGSGLGLAIVKAVIEKHGGEIFVESVPGQGSRFWFTLPVDCVE